MDRIDAEIDTSTFFCCKPLLLILLNVTLMFSSTCVLLFSMSEAIKRVCIHLKVSGLVRFEYFPS